MLFSQIKPWENSEVIQQISTYWEVSTDENFRNIIETKTTTGDSLYFFLSDLTVPSLATYYVRATRQFSNSEANITLDGKAVSNIDSILNNNIIHRDSVKIDRPFIYVNDTEFKNPDFPDFEVRTSSFRCKQDGHVSTNWIVTDMEGNVIFKSLYDKYDKTSKRFDKTNDLLNKTNLIFYVSHVSTNGVESEVCKHVLSNDEFTFDIVGLFENIPPYQELRLYVTPREAVGRDISSIWLKKVNERGEISKSIPVTPAPNSNVIIIPGEELSYGTQLYLDVYGINLNKEQSTKRYKLSTQKTTYTGEIVPHDYQKKFQDYNPSNYQTIKSILPNSFVVTELPNGKVLIPINEGGALTPRIYKTAYRSTETGPVIEIDFGEYGRENGVQIASNRISGTIFKMLNDNILLVESTRMVSGVPKASFRVYSFDIVTNNFTFLHEKTRLNEETPLGIQNCLIQVSRDKIWYLPVGTNTIMEYDFVNNTDPTTVVTLTGNYTSGFMFINRRIGKAIAVNSSGNISTIDIDTKTIEPSTDLPFTDWNNERIKVVELLNGDTLFINQANMNRTNSLVYYNAMENTYQPLLSEVLESSVHLGVIVTRSFSVYILNRKSDSSQDLLIKRLY